MYFDGQLSKHEIIIWFMIYDLFFPIHLSDSSQFPCNFLVSNICIVKMLSTWFYEYDHTTILYVVEIVYVQNIFF